MGTIKALHRDECVSTLDPKRRRTAALHNASATSQAFSKLLGRRIGVAHSGPGTAPPYPQLLLARHLC